MPQAETINTLRRNGFSDAEIDFVLHDPEPPLALFVIEHMLHRSTTGVNFASHRGLLQLGQLSEIEIMALHDWVGPWDYAAVRMIRDVFDGLKGGLDVHSDSFKQYLTTKHETAITECNMHDPLLPKEIQVANSVKKSIDTALILDEMFDKYNEVKNYCNLSRGAHKSYTAKIGEYIPLDVSSIVATTTDRVVSHYFAGGSYYNSSTVFMFPKGSVSSARILSIPDSINPDESEVLLDPKKDAMYIVENKEKKLTRDSPTKRYPRGKITVITVYTLKEAPLSLQARIKQHAIDSYHKHYPRSAVPKGLGAIGLAAIAGNYKHNLRHEGWEKSVYELLNEFSFNLLHTLDEKRNRYINPDDNYILQAIETINATGAAIPEWLGNALFDIGYMVTHGMETTESLRRSIDNLVDGHPWEKETHHVPSCYDVATCMPNISNVLPLNEYVEDNQSTVPPHEQVVR